MTDETSFTPKLGRIRDRGAGTSRRYGAKVRRGAARLAKRAGKTRYTGRQSGRGQAAARIAAFRNQRMARQRLRRVVVKVHIARAKTGAGKAAFRAHLHYIQRDGVDREGPEGESLGGDLYGRIDNADGAAFLTRSEEDRHQFRIIVSPEDGDALGDLKANTRKLMTEVERDLGTRLDWVAVDHYNTGHPHTHIVIRGGDDAGGDLVIARDYLTQGLRERAQDVVTRQLGPRRDLEILQAEAREVGAERFTGLDRTLARVAKDNRLDAASLKRAHTFGGGAVLTQRLRQLEKMGLALPGPGGVWTLRAGWDETLKTMGRRGDIIRSISIAMGSRQDRSAISLFKPGDLQQRPVVGRVILDGPADELRDTRFLLIDGVDGRRWHVPAAGLDRGAHPPQDAIVKVACASPRSVRPADRIIADIAAAHGGVYSEELHRAVDPRARPEFLEAHKRRLEALRRAGFVERLADGKWRVGAGYLRRAETYERTRTVGVAIEIKSWIGIEDQITARAGTWLDGADEVQFALRGFGKTALEAHGARVTFLRENGLLKAGDDTLATAVMDRLNETALFEAAARLSQAGAGNYVPFAEAGRFSGVYERPIDLAQGRFAVIARSKDFTLAPWRKEFERHRGQTLVLERTRDGLSWRLEKTRGIGR